MIALRRRPDWRPRLAEAIEARRREPFAWGRRDCGLFVADCIAAMTGVDLAGAFRGRYGSAEEARSVIRAAGHRDLAALAAHLLEEIRPVRARAGDVAGIEVERSWSLGIVNGERVTVLMPAGLGTVALTDAVKAFRIP